jgi:predicted nucleic acid-binding protein
MAKKPVRVFLDSNVILSGLLTDTGAPRLILDLLSMELPDLIAVTGRYNIIEIERNIRKKALKVLPVYHEYFPKLRIEIVPMPSPADVTKHSGIVADKDTPVLVSAIKGRADFLVTGDKKHFAKVKKAGTLPFRIVNPSEFLESLAALLKEENA